MEYTIILLALAVRAIIMIEFESLTCLYPSKQVATAAY